MKLTREQKAALRAEFRQMSTARKLDYIFEYYKLPIFMAVLAAVILISTVIRIAAKKETVLYIGAVNVSWGSGSGAALTDGFLTEEGLNPKKNEVYVYNGLYMSDSPAAENHEYAYASRIKLMAAANDQKLDLLLMNREAYDLLSQSGYLADLPDLLGPDLTEELSDHLTENKVVVEDNSLEVLLNEAQEETIVTKSTRNGILLSGLSVFNGAGFDGDVYLGVGANVIRPDTVRAYIRYLTRAGSP